MENRKRSKLIHLSDYAVKMFATEAGRRRTNTKNLIEKILEELAKKIKP